MMASGKKVAVVTGSNKGIGFAIVRALCKTKSFDGDVYLTARDEGRGKAAVEELTKEGLHPKFHQLDIDNKGSIEKLKSFLHSTYGGLDILVNNAGIAYKGSSTAPFSEQAEVSCRTNFWSTLDVCHLLFPLLRPHARVVHVSSFASQFAYSKCSTTVQARFKDPKLTMEGLEKALQDFVDAAKTGKHKDEGFPDTAYGMSKVGVTVMAFIQDKEIRNDPREDIVINAVTGSNKGIGFAIVRALCKSFDGDVYLTARDEGRGIAAVEELTKEGLHPKFHQLDIDDKGSIEKLKSTLQSTYGGLDILVRNAGIAYKGTSTAPFSEQAEVICKTNFWSTVDVCRLLFPLLRPHARVVHVSSMNCQSAISKCSPTVQARFKDPNLTMEGLEKAMQDFVDAAKVGKHKDEGFPDSAYGMSKVGVTVMAFIQDREIRNDPREDIVINACTPGYVATDMTDYKGPKTIDEGADTPVYLALLPPNTTSPKGNIVKDRDIKQWY